MKPIIVIPTYNEKDNIEKLTQEIFALSIPDLSIIVVDDNSPDGTAEVVKEMRSAWPIELIARPKKLGLGSAYVAGFKKALSLGATKIIEMDADFSHDPADIPTLLSISKESDLVIGSRKIAGGKIIGWGWMRQAMSGGAMLLSRLLLNLKTKDVTAGFRCFDKKILESINLDTIHSSGYAFQEELLYRTEKKGFLVREIPVTFIDRQKGKSKLSKKDILEFFIVLFKLKFHRTK